MHGFSPASTLHSLEHMGEGNQANRNIWKYFFVIPQMKALPSLGTTGCAVRWPQTPIRMPPRPNQTIEAAWWVIQCGGVPHTLMPQDQKQRRYGSAHGPPTQRHSGNTFRMPQWSVPPPPFGRTQPCKRRSRGGLAPPPWMADVRGLKGGLGKLGLRGRKLGRGWAAQTIPSPILFVMSAMGSWRWAGNLEYA